MEYLLSKKNKAFTIVETLVAITILMIAISGPLTIAQKGLLASVYARDQIVASFLAQDAMEYAKNLKSYNIINRANWLYVLETCTESSPCTIDTLSSYPSNNASPLGANGCSGGSCPLYLKDSGYTPINSSGAVKSYFDRSFYIAFNSLEPDKAIFIITVKWRNGEVVNQVVLQNEVYNTRI